MLEWSVVLECVLVMMGCVCSVVLNLVFSLITAQFLSGYWILVFIGVELSLMKGLFFFFLDTMLRVSSF